jgi:hypothetical protein
MKKYQLAMFGNFESDVIFDEIGFSLQTILNLSQLEFKHNNGLLIWYFESEMDKKTIRELMEINSSWNFKLCVYSFIMGEYHTDKVENSNIDSERIINRDNNQVEDYLEENDEFVTLLLNEIKGSTKQPSLDELLDKICEEGIQSLTPYEKATLDNYSQK